MWLQKDKGKVIFPPNQSSTLLAEVRSQYVQDECSICKAYGKKSVTVTFHSCVLNEYFQTSYSPMHNVIPKFIEAHRGLLAPQSQHLSFPGILINSCHKLQKKIHNTITPYKLQMKIQNTIMPHKLQVK